MIDPEYTIIIDTREQQPWTFKNRATAVQKLDTGDYSVAGLEHLLAIERKKSVSEIATNITEPRFKDVIARLSQMKYAFILLEFSLRELLIYPIGSNIPKHKWEHIKITSNFLLKNITDWEIEHNIKVFFCGSASNAENLAGYLLKKIYNKEHSNDSRSTNSN
jgi:ERCC4-type nuclease